MESTRFTKRKVFWGILILILLVIVAVAAWHQTKRITFSTDSYQAVFLTNNQVYFGKLSQADSGYAILSDVYYIQAFEAQELASADAQGSQLQLVKLGSELHQPEGTMYINKDQILFIESLKADSKIVQAIKNFKSR